jgi:hypothetical protein
VPGFNLQSATRVAINDKAGRERLCRYILRQLRKNMLRIASAQGELAADLSGTTFLPGKSRLNE